MRNHGAPAAWQRVVLDRPERLPVAVVLGDSDRLFGFAVQQEGWAVLADQPAFEIGADWRAVFPHLAADLPLAEWQAAWRAWCQPRNVPPADVEHCALERQPGRLFVRAPARLVQRQEVRPGRSLRHAIEAGPGLDDAPELAFRLPVRFDFDVEGEQCRIEHPREGCGDGQRRLFVVDEASVEPGTLPLGEEHLQDIQGEDIITTNGWSMIPDGDDREFSRFVKCLSSLPVLFRFNGRDRPRGRLG